MDTQLLSIDEIRQNLKDKRLYKVAEACGLSYPTIRRVIDDPATNCTMKTLRRLSDYVVNSRKEESDSIN